MFPLSVRGAVRIAASDPKAVAVTMADLFRGLGFEAIRDGNAVKLANRHPGFFQSRTLATIKRAEMTVEAHDSALIVEYVLVFDRIALFFPVLVLIVGSAVNAWFGGFPKSLVVFTFVAWPLLCSANAVFAGISIEDWIRRGSTAAEQLGAAPLIETHKRRTQQWQTALVIGAPIWILLIASLFALQSYTENRARARFLNDLREASADGAVTVEGRSVSQPDLFIRIVSNVRHIEAHHSSPTREVHVTVTSPRGMLKFVVGEDSERPDEFWVIRGEQEIGRVSDSRLRSILGVSSDVR